MSAMAWLMILLVVAILVGPFLALKAVTKIRSRRGGNKPGDTNRRS